MTTTATMAGIVRPGYGPLTTLRLDRALPVPEPGPGQVRLRVDAAAVNPADVFSVLGTPWVVRLAVGLRRPRRLVPGTDVAGVVDALGPRVTGLAVGDAVFGEGRGSLAGYCLAAADRLAPLPETWTPAQGAAAAMAGTTALALLRTALPEPAGHRLLVIGAGGGIGTFLVQLAAGAGAEVTGMCSAGKADLVRGLGAVETIDYATTDVTAVAEHRGRYDAVVDNVAAHRFRELLPLLRPGGLLVTNSGTGDTDGGALGRPVRATLQRALLRRPVRAVVATVRRADLVELAGLGAAGRLEPVVGATFPLERAADALAVVAGGHARGKVVLEVSGPGSAPRG